MTPVESLPAAERALAAAMLQCRNGGTVMVPPGTYRVFWVNCWMRRLMRTHPTPRRTHRSRATAMSRDTLALAHRMLSFAALTGPLIIPVGITLRGAL